MIEVENLNVRIDAVQLLENVSFKLDQGKVLCIVGESGAGKSTLLKALQGFVPATWDHFLCNGTPRGPELGLPRTRWVMQDPLAALNPMRSLGQSIGESLHRRRISKRAAKQAVLAALSDVELGPEFYNRRPSQVSLGQAQRACIARALVAQPQLIVFDEPLSALDAIVQKTVARQMAALCNRTGAASLIVTHDMGFAAAYADDILVLHRGYVAAYQNRSAFFETPASPYAASLINAAHTLGALEGIL